MSKFNGHFVLSFSMTVVLFGEKNFSQKISSKKFCSTKFLPIIFSHKIPGNDNFYSSHTPLLQNIILYLTSVSGSSMASNQQRPGVSTHLDNQTRVKAASDYLQQVLSQLDQVEHGR